MSQNQNPWAVTIAVGDIPDAGLHREIVADSAQLQALAKVAGVSEIQSAKASFDLIPAAGDQVRVHGRVSAEIVQACIVTLDPVENAIDEPIDVTFVPEAMLGSMPHTKPESGDDDAPEADPPEPIIGGVIDLGKLAADFMFLGIDPYPRKPGASFDTPQTPDDPGDHPFAALQALKDRSGPASGGES